jgi:hypothetical protein
MATHNRCIMTRHSLLLALFCVALPVCADPILPFLSTYTGTQGEDLNIQSADADFDGTNYEFTSTMDAAIGTTTTPAPVFYVWGVDRGLLSNEALFGSFAPNILFDAVVILDDIGGTPGGEVVDFVHGTMTPLPAADVTVSGNTISALVPGADLASMESGSDYLVNLWTRQGIDSTMNNQIAEFAPANGDVPIATTSTPEPAGVSLLGLGIISLTALWKRVRPV